MTIVWFCWRKLDFKNNLFVILTKEESQLYHLDSSFRFATF